MFNFLKELLYSGPSFIYRATRKWRYKSRVALLEEAKPKNTIAVLDGVRAIACLIVIAYHINLITRDTDVWSVSDRTHTLLTALLLSGFSGVTLFFVLSGFLLFLPYARALLYAETWPSARLFYLRRTLRIVPAYYITLLLLLLFYDPGYLQLQHLGDIGLFLTFFMDSTKQTSQQIDGPLWTLAVEWQFYMLLPVLAWGMRLVVRRVAPSRRIVLAIGCLCILIGWGLFTRYWGEQLNQNPNQLAFIPRPLLNTGLFFLYGTTGKYLEDFAVGMLICLCFIYTQRAGGAWLGKNFYRKSLWLWGSGILVLFCLALWNFNQETHRWALPFLSPIQSAYSWVDELGFASGYGLCILAILFNPKVFQRLFAWRPLRALGGISYSLYMWHLPLLLLFMVNVGYRLRGGNGWGIYPLYWLWVIVIIIPFCTIFYTLCEKPGMKLAAKLRQRRLPPALPETRISGPSRELTHLKT
jgi:peptidoglycan/LPS O-acetylase OafA/YrhL